MVTTFFAFVALTVCGFGLCRLCTWRVNWPFNTCIEIGTGFYAVAAIITLFLSADLLSISRASQLVAGIATVGALLILLNKQHWQKLFSLLKIAEPHRVNALGISLIVAFLFFVLINNLHRDIFPWDAFTTWMYRAKTWTLENRAAEFIAIDQWLKSGGAGFSISAAHYPISVSAIAAFAATLSGGWSDQSASMPWFFVTLANALLMAGLCRLEHTGTKLIPIIGCTALVTAPLVHIHGVFAGYADIWIMGTSGMGLASICIWTRQRSPSILYLGFLLLSLGCFWKIEGWVWLVLGILVAVLHWLWQRLGRKAVPIIMLLATIFLLLQPLDLGELGTWGVDADGVQLGNVGTVGLNPYNPIHDYLEMTFWQGNFLLVLPLYLIALISIAMLRSRHLNGYLLVGISIFVCHGIIFGLSAYSEYAQLGTAVNRLVLQTLPVFILTIITTAKAIWSTAVDNSGMQKPVSQYSARYEVLITAIVATLAFPITLIVFSHSPDKHNVGLDRQVYAASDLLPLAGELIEVAHGRQFSGTNIPIGVARLEIRQPGAIQPRYLVTETWMASPGSTSFYWINTATPQVHSLPIPVSGQSIIDMADYPDFWQKPIREMGFLVQPESFQQASLGPLALSNSLLETVPAILNHWMSPAPLNQRLINMATSHISAPVALQAWLTVTFFIICILGLGGAVISPSQRLSALYFVFSGVCVLWLVGCLAHLNQVWSLTARIPSQTDASVNSIQADGSHLKSLLASITSAQELVNRPTLTLALDEPSRFDAQRLPFMLLPQKAALVNEPQLAQLGSNLRATVVIFGQDSAQLAAAANRWVNNHNLQLYGDGAGYVILKAGSR